MSDQHDPACSVRTVAESREQIIHACLVDAIVQPDFLRAVAHAFTDLLGSGEGARRRRSEYVVGHKFLLRKPNADTPGRALAALVQRPMKVVGAGAPVGLPVAKQQ